MTLTPIRVGLAVLDLGRFDDAVIGFNLWCFSWFMLCHERNIASRKIIATIFVDGY
jgi:hypothetical protein